jgi:hypothetical protein
MPSLINDAARPDDGVGARDTSLLNGDPLRGGAPTLADAYSYNAHALADWVAAQRTESAQRGLWDEARGAPTAAGARDAAMQVAQGVALASTAPKDAPVIRAFHGSPHDFEAFDASKIGTGEGAQAYGHGLYVAESEDVARGYRDKLAPPVSRFALTRDGLREYNVRLRDAYSQAAANYADGTTARDMAKIDGPGGAIAQDVLDTMEPEHFKKTPPGRMYEVEIAADPQHFLDWDKPLSEQSPQVQKKLEAIMGQVPSDTILSSPWNNAPHAVLREPNRLDPSYYQTPAGQYQSRGISAEQQLQQAGIPGIKYLDAGSRGAGEGTSNYVVFDPQLMKIVRKYAVPAFATGSAIPAAMGGSQDSQ